MDCRRSYGTSFQITDFGEVKTEMLFSLPNVWHIAAIGFGSGSIPQRIVFLLAVVYLIHLFIWMIWFLLRINEWERDYRKASPKKKHFLKHIRRDWLLRALPFFFVIVPIYWMIVRNRRKKRDDS